MDDATHEQSATSYNTTSANFEVCSPINSSDSSILEVSDTINVETAVRNPILIDSDSNEEVSRLESLSIVQI